MARVSGYYSLVPSVLVSFGYTSFMNELHWRGFEGALVLRIACHVNQLTRGTTGVNTGKSGKSHRLTGKLSLICGLANNGPKGKDALCFSLAFYLFSYKWYA